MASTREHRYTVSVAWTGNLGSGTSGYRDYSRDYDVAVQGKPVIPGSSDPVFRGDRARWNPEELLVASLSACHKLWYLHLASEAGVVVTAYVDRAEGVMEITPTGAGRFKSVILHPKVTVAPGSDVERARALHAPAHEKCFIANSINFPVECTPEIETQHQSRSGAGLLATFPLFAVVRAVFDLVEESFPVTDGEIKIPDRPGLVITIREDFLAVHAVK